VKSSVILLHQFQGHFTKLTQKNAAQHALKHWIFMSHITDRKGRKGETLVSCWITEDWWLCCKHMAQHLLLRC